MKINLENHELRFEHQYLFGTDNWRPVCSCGWRGRWTIVRDDLPELSTLHFSDIISKELMKELR